MIFKTVTTEEELHDFKSLLTEAKLPAEDIDLNRHLLIGAFEDETLIGTGALEVTGKYALLRSLAVKGFLRNKSIGGEMVSKLLDEARKHDVKEIYLLTETAHEYFLKKGFKDVDRSLLPVEIQNTYQFKSACPASAKAMHFQISKSLQL